MPPEFILCLLLLFVRSIRAWKIDLFYSASATDVFDPLGFITVERAFDGNYTANFEPLVDSKKFRSDIREAGKNGWLYRVRAGTDGSVQGYNEPVGLRSLLLGRIQTPGRCLLMRADAAHHIRLSIDPDQHSVQSLAIFPENSFTAGVISETCDVESFRPDGTI
ncbi:unnamed protein product [Gongylonema pulchrum]|uniref:CIA30 domain-containing protein n=1 Tax=Gongylonema pulchrum TaxID=637853 RepID=A0A183EIH7_9BILA|nr:unnamed protein product [Gongylonema pulchrum]